MGMEMQSAKTERTALPSFIIQHKRRNVQKSLLDRNYIIILYFSTVNEHYTKRKTFFFSSSAPSVDTKIVARSTAALTHSLARSRYTNGRRRAGGRSGCSQRQQNTCSLLVSISFMTACIKFLELLLGALRSLIVVYVLHAFVPERKIGRTPARSTISIATCGERKPTYRSDLTPAISSR